jgi:hypothetical protein
MRISPKGWQIMHGSVQTLKRMPIPSGSQALVFIK